MSGRVAGMYNAGQKLQSMTSRGNAAALLAIPTFQPYQSVLDIATRDPVHLSHGTGFGVSRPAARLGGNLCSVIGAATLSYWLA